MYYHLLNYNGRPIPVLSPDYYYRYCYYSSPQYQHSPFYRKLPEVDATLFNKSAITMQNLMKDASVVLNSIAGSKEFAKKIMTAAQDSHLEEVEQLIKSTGIKSDIDTSFNPDGINLKFSSSIQSTECCQLTIALRWR